MLKVELNVKLVFEAQYGLQRLVIVICGDNDEILNEEPISCL